MGQEGRFPRHDVHVRAGEPGEGSAPEELQGPGNNNPLSLTTTELTKTTPGEMDYFGKLHRLFGQIKIPLTLYCQKPQMWITTHQHCFSYNFV